MQWLVICCDVSAPDRKNTLFANILKYLTMKFTSIPLNGADWNKPLLYTVEPDEADAECVDVDILDASTRKSIGSFKIYTSITKSFDIAPYLRASADVRPTPEQSGLVLSPAAFNIRVKVGNVTSENRLFYRSAISTNVSTVLSDAVENDEVSSEDIFKLTILSPRKVLVRVTCYWISSKVFEYSIDTQGKPVEFSYLFSSSTGKDKFTIEVVCEGITIRTYSRSYVQPTGAQTLVWYNSRGGIETYKFPKQTRLCCKAEMENMEDGMGAYARLRSAMTRSLLSSAYESEARIKQLAEIILSPRVYLWRDGGCVEVELLKREIEFNKRGQLLSLDLEIEQEWKGGRLW